jgi:5-methylcytosine-specific restriction endonuclease McrA
MVHCALGLKICILGIILVGLVESGDIRMRDRRYTVHKKPGTGKIDSDKSFEDLLRETRKGRSSASTYREHSLKIHGLICAKCGREFSYTNSHLLTVHHKDGNHRNNPPDGSNWENLCVFCHDDEHSRGLLGDYLSDEE